MNKYEIAKTIKNNKEYTKDSILEDKDIEKIISKVEEKLPEDMSESEKKKIKDNAINIIKENYSYNIDEIAEGINSAIIKYAFGDKNEEIGKSIEKISSANSKEVAKKDSFGKILDLNKFADTL